MIAALADGRELKFPDDMDEREIERIVRMIVTAELGKQKAEDDLKAAHTKVSAVVAKPAQSNADILAALAAVKDSIETGLNRVVSATLADRQMMPDESGEYTRSRAVPRGT